MCRLFLRLQCIAYFSFSFLTIVLSHQSTDRMCKSSGCQDQGQNEEDPTIFFDGNCHPQQLRTKNIIRPERVCHMADQGAWSKLKERDAIGRNGSAGFDLFHLWFADRSCKLRDYTLKAKMNWP